MKVSLVVPLFNEEQTIGAFYDAVRREPGLHGHVVDIVFINDGSSDRTAEAARAIALADSDVVLINLSRNFGKEAALFAGLEYATGEAVVPMDVDLQDPVEVIPRLLAKWQGGADVVLAKRRVVLQPGDLAVPVHPWRRGRAPCRAQASWRPPRAGAPDVVRGGGGLHPGGGGADVVVALARSARCADADVAQ